MLSVLSLTEGQTLVAYSSFYFSSRFVVSFPDLILKRELNGLGTLKHFLGLAHHHMTTHAPIQTYVNNHMIAGLAEPRISSNVPRPFPRVCMVESGNKISRFEKPSLMGGVSPLLKLKLLFCMLTTRGYSSILLEASVTAPAPLPLGHLPP